MTAMSLFSVSLRCGASRDEGKASRAAVSAGVGVEGEPGSPGTARDKKRLDQPCEGSKEIEENPVNAR